MRSDTRTGANTIGTLEAYLKAVDREPRLAASAELAKATKVRELRTEYCAALFSFREVSAAVAHAVRGMLRDAGTDAPAGEAELIEVLVDTDVTSDFADRILADLRSAGSPGANTQASMFPRRLHGSPGFVAYVRRVQRRRAALMAARKEFAAGNLRLVLTMANRYRKTGFLPFADLVQEGNVGLMMAVDRFDPRRGFRFSTYAAWWIRHGITRALSNRGRAVRLPTHVIELRSNVQRFKEAFEAKHLREPMVAEVAEGLGVPEQKVSQLGRVMMQQEFPKRPSGIPGGAADPLDALQGESDDPAERIDATVLGAELRRGLEALPEMERDILRLRFGLEDGLPLTLREIGEVFSLSRERIRQLQVRALGRLRAAMELEGLESPFSNPEARCA